MFNQNFEYENTGGKAMHNVFADGKAIKHSRIFKRTTIFQKMPPQRGNRMANHGVSRQ
jgi:hypothetical protein